MVQNEYLELLLEIGLIGFAIFAVIIAGILIKTNRMPWVWAIIVAFLIQWWFFSGYPNALHVFVILALIYAVISEKKNV